MLWEKGSVGPWIEKGNTHEGSLYTFQNLKKQYYWEIFSVLLKSGKNSLVNSFWIQSPSSFGILPVCHGAPVLSFLFGNPTLFLELEVLFKSPFLSIMSLTCQSCLIVPVVLVYPLSYMLPANLLLSFSQPHPQLLHRLSYLSVTLIL